jgi:hypothetical protein
MLVELSRFRVEDDPYEDVTGGYYVLNTNARHYERDHEDMLTGRKAAAFFDPWKRKIERLGTGDTVFLYRSGIGVVAVGEASGKLQKRPYHDDPAFPEEEFSMELNRFQLVDPALPAAEIKEVTGVNHRFLGTMFNMGDEAGRKLMAYLRSEGRLTAT